jgi:hypothetical protein
MYGSMNEDLEMDEAKTKITVQQKTKFFLHWILLIVIHVFVFWWIPINGNVILYGKAFCDVM